MGNKMVVPQLIKNRITICSRNSTSGYLFKGKEIIISKSHPYRVPCGIISNNQEVETT